jgi:hypothetical protein
MRRAALLTAFALALGVPQLSGSAQGQEEMWQADLQGQGEHAELTGLAQASSTANSATVTTTVTGAQGGATHPWHIHQGTCGSGGPIVGNPTAYPPLVAGDTGNASSGAKLDVGLEPGGEYHVNLHASGEDLATIAACGELRRQ